MRDVRLICREMYQRAFAMLGALAWQAAGKRISFRCCVLRRGDGAVFFFSAPLPLPPKTSFVFASLPPLFFVLSMICTIPYRSAMVDAVKSTSDGIYLIKHAPCF